MKRSTPIFALFLILVIFPAVAFSTVFTAVADGDWSTASTWDQNGVPGNADDVIIDGYTVTLGSGNTTVQSITMTNASNNDSTRLVINGSASLNVSGNVLATAERKAQDVDLQIMGFGSLTVGGNLIFSRAADNNKGDMLRLHVLDDASLTVDGDFTFDYQNAFSTEIYNDIVLEDNALMDITGSLYLYLRDGNSLDFKIKGSSRLEVGTNMEMNQSGGQKLHLTLSSQAEFQVDGNFTMIGSGAGKENMVDFSNSSGTNVISGDVFLTALAKNRLVELELSGAELSVGGDITMSAISDQDVLIDLKSNSNLNIAGNFNRTDFGTLDMKSTTYLTFNGSQPQTVPQDNLPGSGADAFNYTNIRINNTSGTPVTLATSTIIETDLNLTTGVIQSTDTNPLIIADGATITGGSTAAYIDGPVIKRGSTNGLPFVFPIGEGNEYGALEISAVTTTTSEYRAQYFKCPPPFGTNLAVGVNQISSNEYWTLKSEVGSDTVDVRLHWDDAAASGITDLNSLAFSYYHETNGWTSAGNGGTTGGVGAGVSGSITHFAACPPPFGNTKFTFASTSALNPLPVELSRFDARQDGFDVLIEWETSSETNTSHFVVEESEDGIHFRELAIVNAQGFSSETHYYSVRDAQPGEPENYYRLHQIDFDGMSQYSEMVVVNFRSAGGGLLLFPNPIGEYIQLVSNDQRELETRIDIFDQMGRVIYSATEIMSHGKIKIPVSQINLPSTGNYFVVLQNESGVHSLQFVKTE